MDGAEWCRVLCLSLLVPESVAFGRSVVFVRTLCSLLSLGVGDLVCAFNAFGLRGVAVFVTVSPIFLPKNSSNSLAVDKRLIENTLAKQERLRFARVSPLCNSYTRGVLCGRRRALPSRPSDVYAFNAFGLRGIAAASARRPLRRSFAHSPSKEASNKIVWTNDSWSIFESSGGDYVCSGFPSATRTRTASCADVDELCRRDQANKCRTCTQDHVQRTLDLFPLFGRLLFGQQYLLSLSLVRRSTLISDPLVCEPTPWDSCFMHARVSWISALPLAKPLSQPAWYILGGKPLLQYIHGWMEPPCLDDNRKVPTL